MAIPNIKNRGIFGDNTYGVLERLNEIIEAKPSKIFILIGINDVGRNFPDSAISANHKKIVQRIKKASSKTKVYFQAFCR